MMIHCPVWSYFPDKHDFDFIANVAWPTSTNEQIDWIKGITEVEQWLLSYTGPKYDRWAWNIATECYNVSVAFKYDKHRTLFLLNWN